MFSSSPRQYSCISLLQLLHKFHALYIWNTYREKRSTESICQSIFTTRIWEIIVVIMLFRSLKKSQRNDRQSSLQCVANRFLPWSNTQSGGRRFASISPIYELTSSQIPGICPGAGGIDNFEIDWYIKTNPSVIHLLQHKTRHFPFYYSSQTKIPDTRKNIQYLHIRN